MQHLEQSILDELQWGTFTPELVVGAVGESCRIQQECFPQPANVLELFKGYLLSQLVVTDKLQARLSSASRNLGKRGDPRAALLWQSSVVRRESAV